MKSALMLGASILVFVIAACSHRAEPSSSENATASSGSSEAAVAPSDTSIPIGEVMLQVMDPAADRFWGGIGTSLTEAGEVDLSPKTNEEWEKVEGGAATVVIAANALHSPGYRMDPVADWDRYIRNVQAVALRAKAAAKKHDKAAMRAIGDQLDKACEACHLQFSPSPATK